MIQEKQFQLRRGFDSCCFGLNRPYREHVIDDLPKEEEDDDRSEVTKD